MLIDTQWHNFTSLVYTLSGIFPVNMGQVMYNKIEHFRMIIWSYNPDMV